MPHAIDACMNYFAHLHIADHTDTSLLGSFLGDFVKGKDWTHYSPQIQLGIKLHRRVDLYTDQHPNVVALRDLFPRRSRRFAGIATDIVFDHLLLKHWQQFCQADYAPLLDDFYQELADCDQPISRHYTRVRKGLLEYRWLQQYREADACRKALHAVQRRLNKPLDFAEEAYAVFSRHQDTFDATFLTFYADLLEEAARTVESLGQAVKAPRHGIR